MLLQQVQRKIEERIGKEGDTKWLRTLMGAFVKTQPNWNIKTESETTGTNKDHLQGGALLYSNSDKTSHANSKYRILNRTLPTKLVHLSTSLTSQMVVMSSC